MSKGRIKAVYYQESMPIFEVVQKVKKYEQSKYENDDRYKGGFGSYSRAVDSIPSTIIFKVKSYQLDQDVYIDLKEEILSHNNMKKVSKKLIAYLQDNNEGRKVRISKMGSEWTINLDDIDIDYR